MLLNKKNRGYLISGIFFFFNTLGLPSPLLWSNVLCVGYIKKFFENRNFRVPLITSLIVILFSAIHLINGVNHSYLIQSTVFSLIVIYSVFATSYFIEDNRENFKDYFQHAAIISILLLIVGSILLLFNINFFWKSHNFLVGGEVFWRYKGIVYEPSFYAFITIPLLLYFLLRTTIYFSWRTLSYLFMIAVPSLLTLSFGFVGVFIISLFLLLLISGVVYQYFPKKLLTPFLLFVIAFGIIMTDSNMLSNRVNIILAGEDTSINGRTVEAFYLANEMAKSKSQWLGIGLGQIKEVGEDFIRPYYGYKKEDWPTVALPNTMAETLAIFGVLGLILRLGVQIWLFILYKVYSNLFSLFLFVFLFIYQFMGSFIMSTVEYSLWALAIIPIFEEFNLKKLTKATNK